MTILNYILHNLFVGGQKTSTQYSFALRQPLGGRASLACAYANIASQRNFTHEGHNFLTICADRLHQKRINFAIPFKLSTKTYL